MPAKKKSVFDWKKTLSKPLPKDLKKTLSKPAKSIVPLGIVTSLFAIPLWILIPMVLVAIGLSIYLVLTMLPIIVAGATFFFLFIALRWAKMKEPWLYIIPGIMAFVAWIPMTIGPMRAFIVANINTGVAAAAGGAVEAQFSLNPFAGFEAAVAGIVTIITLALVIAVMYFSHKLPVIGKPLAAVIGVLAFVVIIGGVSLSGIELMDVSGLEGQTVVAPAGTVQITFYVTDWQDNPALVQMSVYAVGGEQWTEGGIAVFYLQPNSTAQLRITTPSGTRTRSYWIGAGPETIPIIGIAGFPE